MFGLHVETAAHEYSPEILPTRRALPRFRPLPLRNAWKPQIPAKLTFVGGFCFLARAGNLFPTPRHEPAALKESPTAARRLIWSPRGSFKVDHPVLNSWIRTGERKGKQNHDCARARWEWRSWQGAPRGRRRSHWSWHSRCPRSSTPASTATPSRCSWRSATAAPTQRPSLPSSASFPPPHPRPLPPPLRPPPTPLQL